MRVLITGICGFVGSTVASWLANSRPDWTLLGLDNLIRPGSQTNLEPLSKLGIEVHQSDLRDRELVERTPQADWVIDCAANPSVLAGLDGHSTSQSIMDHNLVGSIHLLEYCKRHQAGLILVSTSRVYSIERMSRIPGHQHPTATRWEPDWGQMLDGPSTECAIERREEAPDEMTKSGIGLSRNGITESFSTQPPLSLYGASKLATELLAQEYAHAFQFPLWINRCGVMAGAGQFGRADQGIVPFWMHSYLHRKRLRYIGFGGSGKQVRDCLHPSDLAQLIVKQLQTPNQPFRQSSPPHAQSASQQPSSSEPAKLPSRRLAGDTPIVCNVSGGMESSFSLLELTQWCEQRWSDRIARDQITVIRESEPRAYDCPWIVLDASLAQRVWDWRPNRDIESIWSEIADHTEQHPHWLELCGA